MTNPDTRQRVAAQAVLGLPAQATVEQFTAAYRRLVKATHHDVSGRTDPDAAVRLSENTAAGSTTSRRHPLGARPVVITTPCRTPGNTGRGGPHEQRLRS